MTKMWFSYFLKGVKKVSPMTKVNTSPLCFKLRDSFFMVIKQCGKKWLLRWFNKLNNVRASISDVLQLCSVFFLLIVSR